MRIEMNQTNIGIPPEPLEEGNLEYKFIPHLLLQKQKEENKNSFRLL